MNYFNYFVGITPNVYFDSNNNSEEPDRFYQLIDIHFEITTKEGTDVVVLNDEDVKEIRGWLVECPEKLSDLNSKKLKDYEVIDNTFGEYTQFDAKNEFDTTITVKAELIDENNKLDITEAETTEIENYLNEVLSKYGLECTYIKITCSKTGYGWK